MVCIKLQELVKRIFRYLNGQPKLRLWYPKDSPFELEAYIDNDYAGSSLDRKSTTGGCQFFGCRLISWQCKKQTLVENSTTKAEYIAASSCCGQYKLQLMVTVNAAQVNPTIYVSCVKQFWATAKVKKVNNQEQIQALVDKKEVIITEDIIRSDLRFDDAEGTACLINEVIFEGLARMGRIGAGFFGIITPLFHTMMVQAPADMGDTPVESHQTPIVDQPLTFKPQKKQKPKRKQRKEEDVSNDESEDEDHVPTPSSDPLPSAKAAQAKEIAALKKKVTKLNKWRKSRSRGLRRLKKFGSDDETQGRTNDDEMFGVDDLAREEVVMDTTTREHQEQIMEDVSTVEPVTTTGKVVTTTVKDSAAPTTNVTKDEITMAQALAALKSIKPKVVVQEQEMSTTIPAAATKVTIAVLTPRAKGIVFHEQNQSQIPIVSSSKDKGKAKMIKPEVPIKKKDQIRIDEELLAERLQAREREEFSKVQKARLLVELIEKRKKHFAGLRAQEKRNKPHTKTQMKSQIEMRKVNDFIAMDSEALESSTKRTAEHLESDISKKQKIDENVKPVINDFEELKSV
nr:ribonuclease H-like domain, reverse transcriptase, RNA-dependent DNA polymerase [Tanacetum cinerariifolium]